MLKDFVTLALANITHRKTRSILTIIGIVIGIAAIVALVSVGSGLEGYITDSFESLGKDRITVMSTTGFSSSPFASEVSANPLTTDDIAFIDKIRGVELATGIYMKPARVEYQGETKNLIVVGYPLDEGRKLFEDMGGFELSDGRILRPNDGRKAIIGGKIAEDVFERKLSAGDSIKIQDERYDIVGSFKKMGDLFNDQSVYVPLETMRSDFGSPKIVSIIYAQAQAGQEPRVVAERVRDKLAKKRGEDKGEETFVAQTAEQLANSFRSLFSVVQAIVLGLAAISLIVGGIGIMNTMYTSVLERTKEIGIMKAVGGKNGDILLIFLIESGILGLLGGLVGVLIGYGLSRVIEIGVRSALGTSNFSASFPMELALGSMAFSFIVGTISGVLPAANAARMKPVDALRYE